MDASARNLSPQPATRTRCFSFTRAWCTANIQVMKVGGSKWSTTTTSLTLSKDSSSTLRLILLKADSIPFAWMRTTIKAIAIALTTWQLLLGRHTLSCKIISQSQVRTGCGEMCTETFTPTYPGLILRWDTFSIVKFQLLAALTHPTWAKFLIDLQLRLCGSSRSTSPGTNKLLHTPKQLKKASISTA